MNVIPDLTVVSDVEVDALDAPLGNERAHSPVHVQPIKLSHYRYEEVLMSVEQIADLTLPLHYIQSSHAKSLDVSMCALAFNYRNGMIIGT